MSTGKFSMNDYPTLQQAQLGLQQSNGLSKAIPPAGPAISNNFVYENGLVGVGRGRGGPRFKDRIQGDPNCIVFIGGLDSSISDSAIRQVFGGFGQITSLARKSKNSMQDSEYAFLAFQNPQQAQCAIQCREIDVMGKKLTIKPRIRSNFQQNRMSSSPQVAQPQQSEFIQETMNTHNGRNMKKGRQVMNMSSSMGSVGHDSRLHHIQQVAHPQNVFQQIKNGPQLLSKGLTVFNIPPNMTPYDLYQIFGGNDAVDGCYIYQWLDNYGRRFAHLLMKSFFFAQKAVENVNGFRVGDYTLEVVYKKDSEPFWFQAPEILELPNRPFTPPYQVLYDAKGASLTGEYPPLAYHQAPLGPPIQDPQFVSAFRPMPHPNVQGSPSRQLSLNHQGHTNGRGRFQYNAGQHYNNPPQGQLPNNGHQAPMIGYDDYMVQQYGYSNIHTGFSPQFNAPPQRNFGHPVYQMAHPPVPTHAPFCGSPPQYGQYNGFVPSPYNGHFSNGQGINSNGFSPLIHPAPTAQVGSHAPFQVSGNSQPGLVTGDPRRDSEGSTEYLARHPNTVGSPSRRESVPPRPSSRVSVAFTENFIAESIDIPPAEKPEDPCNLFVKNLPNDITDDDELKALFTPFGKIVSVHLPLYDGSNSPRGYGFVSFSDEEDAKKALKEMNMKILGSKRLFVNYYESKENRTKRLAKIFGADSKDTDTGDSILYDASSSAALITEDKPMDMQLSPSSLKANASGNNSRIATPDSNSAKKNVVATSSIVQEPVVVTSAPAALTLKNLNIANPLDGTTTNVENDKVTTPSATDTKDEKSNTSENSAPMSQPTGRRAPVPAIEEIAEGNNPKPDVRQDALTSDNMVTGNVKKGGVKPAVPSFGRNKSMVGSPSSSKSKLPIPSPKDSIKSLHPVQEPVGAPFNPSPTAIKVRPSGGANQTTNGLRKGNKKRRNAGKSATAAVTK